MHQSAQWTHVQAHEQLTSKCLFTVACRGHQVSKNMVVLLAWNTRVHDAVQLARQRPYCISHHEGLQSKVFHYEGKNTQPSRVQICMMMGDALSFGGTNNNLQPKFCRQLTAYTHMELCDNTIKKYIA